MAGGAELEDLAHELERAPGGAGGLAAEIVEELEHERGGES
jgi:hypothetical protein